MNIWKWPSPFPFPSAGPNSIQRYLKLFPDRNPNSILVDDFAYNIDQIEKDKFPHFLERLERSESRFSGLMGHPSTNIWWVNHKQTFSHEVGGN